MLTAKENMRAAVFGGTPDRFVNQYEALSLVVSPAMMIDAPLKKGGPDVVNSWGITRSWPENVPGGFPVHTPDKIVIKDIEHWQDYVHAPTTQFPQELWDVCKGMVDNIDGTKAYKAVMIAPGLFEQTHHLSEIANALCYYMEYEDEMHDLVKYLTDYELALAEGICSNMKVDAVFHHDDWGSETNSFLRPSMFEDYFVDAYKQIYGYYKSHGVEIVVHHSDSFGANLVDSMIEMGIDVWQGCMRTNNVPELLAKYKGKITFMGDIDNKFVDFEGWTPEVCEQVTRDTLARYDSPVGYIPCITQGGPGSVYPGTYMEINNTIDKVNEERFGTSVAGQNENRPPINIMF